MAQDIKQDLLFYGGMNSDDSYELLPQGDYPLALNITNDSKQDDNQVHKVIPRKGNHLIDNTFYVDFIDDNGDILPLIDRIVCGSVRDEVANKIYYFVYEVYGIEGISSIEKFWSIYEFDCYTKTISNQVCRLQFAFFDQTNSIKFGNVLFGNLFYVQNGIKPKSINIEKAINYTKNVQLELGVDTLFSPAYANLSLREFNVIKRPPITPLQVIYASNEDVLTNNIRGKLFQFRYRYVYRDNTESVWSSISEVALPHENSDLISEINTSGFFVESNKLNYIEVEYAVDTKEVKEVQIAKREYSAAEKIPTAFEVVYRDYINDDSEIGDTFITKTYNFYNDIAGQVLSDREENTLYDTVPLSANSMEVISNPDKIVYAGDIVEAISRDNIIPEVEISVIKEVIDDTSSETNTNFTFPQLNIRTSLHPYWIEGGALIKDFHYNMTGTCTAIYIPVGFTADSIVITLKFAPESDVITKSFNVSIDGLVTQSAIRDAIASKINDEMGGVYAYSNRTTFEDATLGAGGFHDAVTVGGVIKTNRWRYIDWAFCAYAPLYSDATFNGYHGDEYDYYNLNNNVVFIHTGRILAISGATFHEIIADKKGVTSSTTAKRDAARVIGDTLGVNIIENNNNIYDDDFTINDYVHFLNFDSFNFKKITQTSEHIQNKGTISATSNFIIDDDTISSNQSLQVTKTLAPFGEYGVGIVYYDEDYVNSYVQECGSSVIERTNGEYGDAVRYKLQLDIGHLAPSWARYWQPVLTENKKMQNFFEIDISIDTGGDLVTLVGANVIKMRVNEAINKWQEFYNNTLDSLPEYTFTQGDRIILYNNSSHKYFDREILKQEDEFIYISNIGTVFTNANHVDRLIKIYTPKKTELVTQYFEVGELNEVLQPFGRHRNNKTLETQTYPTVSNLEYIIDFGDCYMNTVNHYKVANSISPIWQVTYNEFYRVFYPSKMSSYGRVHFPQNIINTQPVKDRFRVSYATVENANIKGWNKFDFVDKVDLGDQYGKIVGLATMGYTLKVITELKLISVYVNRSVPVNPDGTESIIITDRTIGGISIPEYNRGCKHPDSIIKNNRNLYYYNADNGMVIRDSANGQYPINKYKYESYFEKISKIVNSDSSNIKVLGAFNKDDDEYFLIFNNDNSNQNLPIDNDINVVIFNEEKNRWTSHVIYKDENNITPEWVDFSNDTLIFFLKGQVYFENSDISNRCNYFGVQRIPYVDAIVNPDPKKIKTYRSIAIHSSDKWSMPENDDILIYPTVTYPNGMSSRLKPNKLIDKEGVFYSEFLGDGLSKPEYIQGLINGRQLRGNIMRIRLRCLEVNSDSELFTASVRFNYSEHSY